MALSGQVKTNAFSEEYGTVGLQFDWSATQSVESNTSTISWTLRTFGTMTSSYWYKAGPISMTMAATSGTLGGTKSYSNSSRIQLRGGTVIASGTATLTHSASGVGAFSVSLSAAIYYTSTNVTGSGTGSLDSIARATTPAFTNTSGTTITSVELGSAFRISVAGRASAGFSHEVSYTFGSASGTLATIAADASSQYYEWTPPASLGAQIPNAATGQCTVTVKTYNGTALIGTKSAAIAFTAPASWVPSNSTAVEPSNKALGNAVYPATVSGVKVEVTCGGSNSSTIRDVTVIFQGKTYTTQTVTSGKATIITDACVDSGSFTLETVVTDSRGRTKSASQTVTVTAYNSPAVSLELTRVASPSGSTASEAGGYMRIVFSAEAANAGSNAAIAASLKYTVSGGQETALSPAVSGRTASYTSQTNIAVAGGLTCTVEASLTDTAGNTTKVTKVLPVGFKTVNVRAGGKGIAFGTMADADRLISAMDAEFREAVTMAKTLDVSGKLTAGDDLDVGGDLAVTGGINANEVTAGQNTLSGVASSIASVRTRQTGNLFRVAERTKTIDLAQYASANQSSGVYLILLRPWTVSLSSGAVYLVSYITNNYGAATCIEPSANTSLTISGKTVTITFPDANGGMVAILGGPVI